MSSIGHYSAERARRSLGRFLGGKAASAAAGLTVLLVTVRAVDVEEYGRYVSVIAGLEIFYLLTGLGLSTVAQRYVTQVRLLCDDGRFSAFIWRICARRLTYAALGAAAFLALVLPEWGSGIRTLMGASPWWVAALLVLGSMSRFLDEVFPALLMQGTTQALTLAAHAVRLTGVSTLWWQAGEVSLMALVWVELAAVSASLCAGLLALRHYLGPADASGDPWRPDQTAKAAARKFYLIQILGQVWSPNAAKLVVAQWAGLGAAAALGFALAIAEMFRNYLPAFLLASWVRPMMIARYLERRQLNDILPMATLLFKLSILGLVPALAIAAAQGSEVLTWLSGGKVMTSGPLLLILFMLVAAQCAHVAIGMLTLTLEQPAANLRATALACVALPASALAAAQAGPAGAAWILLGAELFWVAAVLLQLRWSQIRVQLPARSTALLLLSVVPGYLAAGQLPPRWFDSALGTAAALACSALAVGVAVVTRPVAADERELVRKVIAGGGRHAQSLGDGT